MSMGAAPCLAAFGMLYNDFDHVTLYEVDGVRWDSGQTSSHRLPHTD